MCIRDRPDRDPAVGLDGLVDGLGLFRLPRLGQYEGVARDFHLCHLLCFRQRRQPVADRLFEIKYRNHAARDVFVPFFMPLLECTGRLLHPVCIFFAGNTIRLDFMPAAGLFVDVFSCRDGAKKRCPGLCDPGTV